MHLPAAQNRSHRAVTCVTGQGMSIGPSGQVRGTSPDMTLLWAGLASGAIYGLVAVGYNIVFVSSGAFNFAHAQLIMLGTFIAYWGLTTLHWPVLLVFVLSAVIVGAAAVAEERFAIRTVVGVEAQLVTTVGVATLLNGVTEAIWGAQPLEVPFFGSSKVLVVFGGRVFPDDLWIIGSALVITGALTLISRRTMTGIALLAVSEDREAASLRGINVRSLAIGAFAVSGIVAGVTGPIIGPSTFAVATLGTSLALYGFVALAMGGFGSLGGGLLGGLVVGLVASYSGRYLGENYSNTAIFVVLVAVLLIRPSGLFGQHQERVV